MRQSCTERVLILERGWSTHHRDRKRGSADLFSSEDVEVPVCQDGEVLVDVYAAGLNFFE
jgi:hypothetical protein